MSHPKSDIYNVTINRYSKYEINHFEGHHWEGGVSIGGTVFYMATGKNDGE
jgi:hypothetical protein